jgi:hypothetical protein
MVIKVQKDLNTRARIPPAAIEFIRIQIAYKVIVSGVISKKCGAKNAKHNT